MTKMNRLLLHVSTAALAMACAGQTLAQTAAPAAGAVEEVVVTATRITRSGYDAPTPTTVIGEAEIAKQAHPNVFQAVAELPSLMGSTGVTSGNNGTSGGNTGLSAFGIHGLGTIRTLTLIDGQRVVPAFVQGTNDISQFPQLLIQRVDVVTGGASASYGSDAVAGVVNFVTDKTFKGFKTNFLTGVTTYGDDANALLQAAWGTDFAGGRGHVQVSGEYAFEDGVGPGSLGVGCASGKNGRCWYTAPTILQRSIPGTPAGEPQYIFAEYVQDFQLAKYGIITAGPLRGITFGDNGVPMPFQYGSPQISPFAIGGDLTGNIGNGTSFAAALRRANVYARASYEVNDKLNVWATFMSSEVDTRNVPTPRAFRPAGLTIQCDNAFLPATIKTQCAANNITSFQFGTSNGQLPVNQTVRNDRTLNRLVLGADGRFDLFEKEWSWNAYFEHGEADTMINVANIWLNPYYNAAIDAITLPSGQIVCRSTVARAQGCVPYNVIGNAGPQQLALEWLFKDRPRSNADERQEVFALTFNGEPFSLWAGPISIATGVEVRQEAYEVSGDPAGDGGTTDPLLSPAGNNWFAGNFHRGQGKYDVKEAFIETAIPLFETDGFGKADLSLAGRVTEYSTSGRVETWKVGATWETFIDGLKFRALKSRDIRAPNLSELFAAEVVTNGSVNNRFTGTAQIVQNVVRGNTNLTPEISTNTQFGVVYQPSWFSGFRFSADYYNISIRDLIGSLGSQTIADLCFQGFQAQCAAIITTTGGPPATTPFNQVINQAFNLASVETNGVDIESSYRFQLPFMPGDFTVRALGTKVFEYTTNSGVPGQIPVDSAGMNGGNIPEWKVMALQTYSNGPVSFTLTERWNSDGVINSNYIQCTTGCPLPTVDHPTINNNYVSGRLYYDLGGSWDFREGWQAYFKINNLGNEDPPPIPATQPNSYGANASLYDTIGRMYRLGFRVTY